MSMYLQSRRLLPYIRIIAMFLTVILSWPSYLCSYFISSLHTGYLQNETLSSTTRFKVGFCLCTNTWNTIMGGMCALPVDEWRSPAGFADKVLEEWILEVSLCCSRHFAHHTAVIGSLDTIIIQKSYRSILTSIPISAGCVASIWIGWEAEVYLKSIQQKLPASPNKTRNQITPDARCKGN